MSDVTAPGGIAIAKPATRPPGPVTNGPPRRTLGLGRPPLVVVGPLVELGLRERQPDRVAVGGAIAELARDPQDLPPQEPAGRHDAAGDDRRPRIADQL